MWHTYICNIHTLHKRILQGFCFFLWFTGGQQAAPGSGVISGGYSSAQRSSAMLCSWAMAASSFRNSAYRMMANTRLLAWGAMGGQGGRTPRGGKGRAFLREPLGRDGSRMRSPPWDWRHSETPGKCCAAMRTVIMQLSACY